MSELGSVTRPAEPAVPVIAAAEVVVVGGGPGGLGAAVGAARQGARVLLIERYGCLGGMATIGGVNPFMPSHLDGRRLDSGAFLEWCAEMAALGGIDDRTAVFNAEVAKLAAERLLLNYGVELLYHASFDRPLLAGETIEQLLLHTKSGTVAVQPRLVVDCTGDADVAARAGCPFEYGRPEDGGCQPMTANFDVGGVELERMPRREVINDLYDRARAEGRLTCPRENVLYFRTLEPGRIHFNTTRIIGRNATDVRDLTAAEIESRRQIAEYLTFLRRDVPGFENCYLLTIGQHIGVRESRRIRGRAYIGLDDYVHCRKFPDGILRCTYNIDIHSPTGAGTEHLELPRGEWYEVPYGCLVPLGANNLLVGGRPISVDHAVHSSLRVMPPACTLGQAAGVAAALAVQHSLTPAEIDGVAVKQALIEQGVWLVSGAEQVGPGGECVGWNELQHKNTA